MVVMTKGQLRNMIRSVLRLMAQQATFERLYFASGRVKFRNSKERMTMKMVMKMAMQMVMKMVMKMAMKMVMKMALDDGDGDGTYTILTVSSSVISKK